jgi:hypothetical protein
VGSTFELRVPNFGKIHIFERASNDRKITS